MSHRLHLAQIAWSSVNDASVCAAVFGEHHHLRSTSEWPEPCARHHTQPLTRRALRTEEESIQMLMYTECYEVLKSFWHTWLTLNTEMGWEALSPWATRRSSRPSPSKSVTVAPVTQPKHQLEQDIRWCICTGSVWGHVTWPVPLPWGSEASPTSSSVISGPELCFLDTLHKQHISELFVILFIY